MIIKPTIRKSKGRADGTHTVYIFLRNGERKKYIATSVSVPLADWDFNKNSIKPSRITNDNIFDLQAINSELEKYTNARDKLLRKNLPISVDAIAEMVNKNDADNCFYEFFLYEQAKQINKPKTTNNETYAFNLLLQFAKNDLRFKQVNADFFQDFILWLTKLGKSENTIYAYMQAIRKYVNLAIRKKCFEENPLLDVKYKRWPLRINLYQCLRFKLSHR